MKRGDIILVAPPGAYGKPRPAVIVQSDLLNHSGLSSVIVCLISSHVEALLFRINVPASTQNGLQTTSQIMTDKIMTVPKERMGKRIGTLEAPLLKQLEEALTLCLGMTKLH